MTTWTDETLALSVTEATMQDWLAAAATIRDAPPTFFDARPAHPAVRRPAIERRNTVAVRTRPAPKAAATAGGAGGARTVFWLLLAGALAVLAYL